MRRFLHEESVDNDKGLTTLGEGGVIPFCFVVLLNFRTVFSPVPLFSATHAGVCTFGRSGESEGIVEGIVERVVCIVSKFCFCRDWRRISILETGIPKLKTGCFRNRG